MGSRSQSIRRWWEHRHALWRVSPGELVELQKGGIVSEGLKPYAVLAQEEALGLATALGGADEISEQKLLLIRDIARLGLVLRAVLARFVQGDGDPELASRVATLTSARRANLALLGLERREKDLDLAAYLAQAAQNRAGAPNGVDSGPSATGAPLERPEARRAPPVSASTGGKPRLSEVNYSSDE